jgi:hypothetical protein
MLSDDEIKNHCQSLTEAADRNDNAAALRSGVALLSHVMCCIGTIARSLEAVAGPMPKAPSV